MVFCRKCERKVEDCEHLALPIEGKRVRVFDEKVETLAYAEDKRILEVALKNGQVWQLAEVPAGIYAELRKSTIGSFLKFMATRYPIYPVKTGIYAIAVPKEERCPVCESAMKEQNRTAGALNKFIRVFWLCPQCKKSKWESYGSPPARQRRERWH